LNRIAILLLSGWALSSLVCCAQQRLPDAPSTIKAAAATPPYSPPTQGDRLRFYLRHTYGTYSLVEAGVRAGIDQARDSPSEWPQGGQGYADRFGSVMGQVAVRGTTEYLISDLLGEDLRPDFCFSPCPESRLERALEDTFTARKGEDGHRVFSVARFAGPIVGGTVATTTWYPSGYRRGEILRQTVISYGFSFLRNYVRKFTR
jgi:hypothetical protein